MSDSSSQRCVARLELIGKTRKYEKNLPFDTIGSRQVISGSYVSHHSCAGGINRSQVDGLAVNTFPSEHSVDQLPRRQRRTMADFNSRTAFSALETATFPVCRNNVAMEADRAP